MTRMLMLRTTLFMALITVAPAGARAQDSAPPPPQEKDKQEARAHRAAIAIDWTFNFDAGWGSFGFANSLFDNPKEPGVDENLSDQWFEGYVKPAFSGSYNWRRPARSTAR